MPVEQKKAGGQEEQSLAQRAGELLDSVRPYLHGDGLDVRMEGIEDETLLVEFSSEKPADPALVMLWRIGLERKLVESDLPLRFVKVL